MGSLLDRGAVCGGDGLHHPDQARQDRLSAPGRDIDYRLTDDGWALFDQLGVIVPRGRRKLVAYCVDWTEQRHHLAGTAGAALLSRFTDLGWLCRDSRKAPRALTVTEDGRDGFGEYFRINTEQLATPDKNISTAGVTGRA